MTPEKTKEALYELCQIVKTHGAVEPKRLDAFGRSIRFDFANEDRLTQMNHLLFIATDANNLIDADRIEKSMRHLGWVQGALWGMGLVSIEELMKMNRPDK